MISQILFIRTQIHRETRYYLYNYMTIGTFNFQVGAILCFVNHFLEKKSSKHATSEQLGLGIVLITLILVTAMFSHYQESQSSRIMESFQQLLPQKTVVLRDGRKKALWVTDLVVGDIVLLETGDRVPADIRILECQGKFVSL